MKAEKRVVGGDRLGRRCGRGKEGKGWHPSPSAVRTMWVRLPWGQAWRELDS